jgi:hypothetical protein
MALWKERVAALASRFSDTNTSMLFVCVVDVPPPETFTSVSSTNQRLVAQCRQGLAVSVRIGVVRAPDVPGDAVLAEDAINPCLGGKSRLPQPLAIVSNPRKRSSDMQPGAGSVRGQAHRLRSMIERSRHLFGNPFPAEG